MMDKQQLNCSKLYSIDFRYPKRGCTDLGTIINGFVYEIQAIDSKVFVRTSEGLCVFSYSIDKINEL